MGLFAGYANYALLFAALPFCLWATFSDLKYMTIPNKLVMAMAVAFIAVGITVLPYDIFLWRFLVGLIVLAVGFLLFAIGGMGGGDAKFGAVMVLFVAYEDLVSFVLILALVTLIAVTLHFIIGKMPFAKNLATNWKSWEKNKKFPLGFGMGAALVCYLVLEAVTV